MLRHSFIHSFTHSFIHSFIHSFSLNPQPALRQDRSLFQSHISTTCDQRLPLSKPSILSFQGHILAAYVYFPLFLLLLCFLLSFLPWSVLCQFPHTMWPIQLTFLLFIVCSTFLFSFISHTIGPSDLLHPSSAPHLKNLQVHHIYFPQYPNFSTPQSYTPNVTLAVSQFQHHTKLHSKCYTCSIPISASHKATLQMQHFAALVLKLNSSLPVMAFLD